MATHQDIFKFRAKFPEFADIQDAGIAAWLNVADTYLDASIWGTDFEQARMFWAAHWLQLQQVQIANATIDGTGFSDLFVRQISIGERRILFQQRKSFEKTEEGSGPGEIMLSSSPYGQQFLMLRHRNVPPILTV